MERRASRVPLAVPPQPWMQLSAIAMAIAPQAAAVGPPLGTPVEAQVSDRLTHACMKGTGLRLATRHCKVLVMFHRLTLDPIANSSRDDRPSEK